MHDEHRFLWPMFWGLFALAIILTRRFTRHRERMRALEMAERLAEKGVAPPEVVTQTLAPPLREPRVPAEDIRNGAILIAVAVGMIILGFVMDLDDTRMGHGGGLSPLFGAAAFPGLIGLVILAFGLANRNKV
jgi:hypothetical protein